MGNPYYYKPERPNMNRRANWHDYRSRSVYMITIAGARGLPPLAELVGGPEIHVVPTILGRLLSDAIDETFGSEEKIAVLQRQLMPDHIHFILFVKAPVEEPLGYYVRKVKGLATSAIRRVMNASDLKMFAPGFNDRILYAKGQLDAMRRYVADNPRRLWLRRQHPELFTLRQSVSVCGEHFDAVGNMFLLDEIDFRAVVVHRVWTAEELGRATSAWLSCAANGGILVSPFISKAEKEVLTQATEAGGRVILLTNQPLSERYKPSGKYFDLCSSGRLLVLHPSTMVPASCSGITRAEALALNACAERIAGRRR